MALKCGMVIKTMTKREKPCVDTNQKHTGYKKEDQSEAVV